MHKWNNKEVKQISLYVLEGKAVYHHNQDWVEVEAGDYMWLRAFCPQACYAGGPGNNCDEQPLEIRVTLD